MRFLFIDIDTLRASHLGCYGYHRQTSPNIDTVAADGVRFTNVYASDVPCLPSRTALITGLFGIRNGVVNHGGLAADLRPEGAGRGFVSSFAARSWAAAFHDAGWHTASLSSFPLRHSASWWNHGFAEALNLMRGAGGERADQVLPGALDWLDRRGSADEWFLHVHFWDPHTPYNTPDSYGNPFEADPPPAWHTEDVRAANWLLAGPHSAQEPFGFTPDEHGPLPPRQPRDLASMEDVKRMFDGFDVGVRYADDAVGVLLDKLDALGVLDETAVLISSDHGEAFGELGVYADHQAADQATANVPSILRWPGVAPMVDDGLHYHLDVAATVVELAGLDVDAAWDGVSVADGLRRGDPSGREHLVVSQGAWSCQRGVRWGDLLYLHTRHDGFHPHWGEEMLFDVAVDPHEQRDLAESDATALREGRSLLQAWTADQLGRSYSPLDPIDIVLAEGGPFHVRGRQAEYMERLRSTGRARWADAIAATHSPERA